MTVAAGKGILCITDKSGTQSCTTGTLTVIVPFGEMYTFFATPDSGQAFDYYLASTGTKFYDNPTTMAIGAAMTMKVYFKSGLPRVCNEGDKQITEYCSDGVTPRYWQECVGGVWTSKSQNCPSYPLPPAGALTVAVATTKVAQGAYIQFSGSNTTGSYDVIANLHWPGTDWALPQWTAPLGQFTGMNMTVPGNCPAGTATFFLWDVVSGKKSNIITLTIVGPPSPIVYKPSITVVPTTIKSGTNFTVTGVGFDPGGPVEVYIVDLYGNRLQGPSSKSPTSTGALSIQIMLDANVTYSGTGYIYATQLGGIESNHAQISVTPATLTSTHYFTLYARLEVGEPPESITFYVKDFEANVYLARDILTIPTLGKIICFKRSGTAYDSHKIQISVKNAGNNPITITYGIARDTTTSTEFGPVTLAGGAETSVQNAYIWANYSDYDYDFSRCEGTAPPPPKTDCDDRYPGRSVNPWEWVGWGVCTGASAVMDALQPIFQPIFEKIAAIADPFLKPFQDAVSTLQALGTSVTDFLKDPWADLTSIAAELFKPLTDAWDNAWNKTVADAAAFFKPVTDGLAKINVEFPDIGKILNDWLVGILPESIKRIELWAKDPRGEALKVASSIGEGLYGALEQVFRVTDPIADLFNPTHYRTDAVKEIAGRIYDVLSQGQFPLAQLVTSIIFAPWLNLSTALEDMLLGTEPATYENAKARASALILIQADVTALIASMDALTSILPASLRILDRIPPGVRALIASVMVLRSVSDIYAPAMEHGIKTPLERQWRSIALDSRPDPSAYMSLRAEGEITKDDYTERMKGAGYSPEVSELLYLEYLREPNYGELATLYRRGKISQTAFANLREVARLNRKYGRLDSESGEAGSGDLDAWMELIYRDPAWREIRVMAESGKLTDAQIDKILTAMGTPPEYMDVLHETVKELAGRAERRATLKLEARLVALGRQDEATYYADATELKIAKEIADILLREERTRLKTGAEAPTRQESIGNLNTWYMNDIIDPATYRAMAEALSYESDFIDKQLAYLDKKKAATEPTPSTPAEREAARSMWDTWYENDVIDASALAMGYTKLGYTNETIGHQLELLDKRKAAPEKDVLESEAKAAFKDHVIDEATYRTRLEALGRTDDAIDLIIATAKAEQTVTERDANVSVWRNAYRYGIIERGTYLAHLIDASYTSEAAELIVETDEAQWKLQASPLTQSQTLNSYEEGFIDYDAVWKRLQAMRIGDGDIRILLSFSVRDMLKAHHLTNVEADKLWTTLTVEPDIRAKLMTWYGWKTP